MSYLQKKGATLALFLLFLFLLDSNLICLETSDRVIDASINYNFGLINGKAWAFNDFRPCCGTLENGISNGLMANFNYSFYDISYGIKLSAFLGFAHSNFIFQKDEPELINVGGENFNGTFRHSLDLNNYALDFGFSAIFMVDRFKINFALAPTLFLANSYESNEKIVVPDDRGYFIDTGTRQRNVSSGNFDFNLGFVTQTNIAYQFPLNFSENLFLEPNISLQYRYFSPNNAITSHNLNLGFGIGLSYYIDREFKKINTPIKKKQVDRNFHNIDLFAIDTNGNIINPNVISKKYLLSYFENNTTLQDTISTFDYNFSSLRLDFKDFCKNCSSIFVELWEQGEIFMNFQSKPNQEILDISLANYTFSKDISSFYAVLSNGEDMTAKSKSLSIPVTKEYDDFEYKVFSNIDSSLILANIKELIDSSDIINVYCNVNAIANKIAKEVNSPKITIVNENQLPKIVKFYSANKFDNYFIIFTKKK